MFTEEQLRQKIAIAYKTGFHAGIKWAKEGGNIERTIRQAGSNRAATRQAV